MTIDEIIELFGIDETHVNEMELSPNLFPGQNIAAIIYDGKRKLVKLTWGLVPGWLRETRGGQLHARAETVNRKPFFRDSFKKRRTLIISAGYYQWKKTGNEKTPVYVRMKTGLPFLMAGVYESSDTVRGGSIGTCAIITTEANEPVRTIHDRMPVIIDSKDMEPWLDSTTDEERVLTMLRPPEPGTLELVPGRFAGKQFIPS